ncbi:CU044_5270 family protein [Streptomyces sp. AV19]|uniref:CU044_5270 family protein n=1 Tax=Streptomyces sp. AV19 TaxID=2793068 RepID=UPI0018FE9CE3|nr:CU044_5270 family protein [Streptomyces sp. AV19]MBH1934327.1 CU044_5270 family protein [Streptomyces sp. AV19]MDG4533365.1 CU044_5270 family protein [Streptomyces sp. AV19]
MNTTEHQDLARRLPAPAERDLPPGRHLHHKELLMRTIDGDRPRPRRHLVRPAFALPAAAAVVAGALAVTALPGSQDRTSGTRVAPAEPGTPRGAVVLLDRIATVAMRTDTKPVRDDQYVYVRSLATETVHIKPVEAGGLKEREDWVPQDPRPSNDGGVFREDGKFLNMNLTGHKPAGIERPTYKWLASLPADPAALHERIRKETMPIQGQDFGQTVFDTFGTLLSRSVMPSRTEAALYKAAAKIPGVVQMPDAVDAQGRHGVAIAREDRQLGQRTEWIFDKKSLKFLGQRTYLTKTGDWGKAGTLVRATAILDRAVVDRARQIP